MLDIPIHNVISGKFDSGQVSNKASLATHCRPTLSQLTHLPSDCVGRIFHHQPFGEKTRGRFAKVAGLARIAAPTEAHRVRSVRLPVTATRSVNLPFENHIEFFGIDGLAGFQPINSLLYLKLPEKP